MINLWDCKMMINKGECFKKTNLHRIVSNLSSILKTPKQASGEKSGRDAPYGFFSSPILIIHNYLPLIVVTHKITDNFTLLYIQNKSLTCSPCTPEGKKGSDGEHRGMDGTDWICRVET